MSAVRIKKAQIPIVKQRILDRRQNFLCAICDLPITVATGCLDHDHSTGAVRGVLCRNCNGIEGKIKNLVTRARRGHTYEQYLVRVIKYWRLHATNTTGLLHPLHLDEEEKRIKRNTKARASRLRAKKGKR